jgi:hypothetical protein
VAPINRSWRRINPTLVIIGIILILQSVLTGCGSEDNAPPPPTLASMDDSPLRTRSDRQCRPAAADADSDAHAYSFLQNPPRSRRVSAIRATSSPRRAAPLRPLPPI